jgi:predicted ArsR family transcriptional regulator
MTHLQKWIVNLIDGLDKQVDKKIKMKILESCGRNCISQNFIKKAQSCKNRSKNKDEFLNQLMRIWKHLRREGNNIYVVYERCYCPLVKTYQGKLPATFCNCSLGWIRELFEKCLEKPVKVVLEKSIKKGDNICKFRVHL